MEKGKEEKKGKKLPDEALGKVVAGFGEYDRYSCMQVADNATFIQYVNANPNQCPNFQPQIGTDRNCYSCTNFIRKFCDTVE